MKLMSITLATTLTVATFNLLLVGSSDASSVIPNAFAEPRANVSSASDAHREVPATTPSATLIVDGGAVNVRTDHAHLRADLVTGEVVLANLKGEVLGSWIDEGYRTTASQAQTDPRSIRFYFSNDVEPGNVIEAAPCQALFNAHIAMMNAAHAICSESPGGTTCLNALGLAQTTFNAYSVCMRFFQQEN